MAPVQELAGKTSTATAWVQASFELDPDENVTDAEFTILQVGGGGNPTAAESRSEVPTSIRLGQNYPNPFNPSTTIPFTIQESAHVTLAIHDVLGREVEVISDRIMTAGDHTVSWDAGRLPSGVYRVRLSVEGEVRTRPIVLSK